MDASPQRWLKVHLAFGRGPARGWERPRVDVYARMPSCTAVHTMARSPRQVMRIVRAWTGFWSGPQTL